MPDGRETRTTRAQFKEQVAVAALSWEKTPFLASWFIAIVTGKHVTAAVFAVESDWRRIPARSSKRFPREWVCGGVSWRWPYAAVRWTVVGGERVELAPDRLEGAGEQNGQEGRQNENASADELFGIVSSVVKKILRKQMVR
jgi:hypothetical protein